MRHLRWSFTTLFLLALAVMLSACGVEKKRQRAYKLNLSRGCLWRKRPVSILGSVQAYLLGKKDLLRGIFRRACFTWFPSDASFSLRGCLSPCFWVRAGLRPRPHQPFVMS